MAIVKRLTKGSALTHAELDGNFTDLDTRVSTLEGAPDSDSQTLTLVGTDLSISSGNTVDLSGLGGGAGGIALTDISVTSLAAAGGGTLTYDNTTGVFDYTPPDLSSFSTFDGDYNSLTNKPTIPSALTDLGIVDGTNGQVLTTDGAGSFTFTTVTGGSGIALADLSVGAEDPASGDGGISYDNTTGVFTYAPPDLSLYQPVGNLNADIDAHLNTSTATANQILSWDGADYAWVADQTGAGSSYGDSDVATYLNGNLDSHIIPDTNATYDIGSAEFKIRHLYLSSTSMYMGANDVPIQLSADEKSLAINSVPLKVSTAIADEVAGPIDITITNHFIQNGNTYTLLDSGTYIGQELKFWKVGDGPVATYADITVGTANVTDAAGIPSIELGFTWRLGDANVGMYSCCWDGNAWVLSSGGPGV